MLGVVDLGIVLRISRKDSALIHHSPPLIVTVCQIHQMLISHGLKGDLRAYMQRILRVADKSGDGVLDKA